MPNDKSSAATSSAIPTPETIAKRAYELFLQRGSVPGFELDDWLQAEAELIASTATRREATSRNGRQAAH